MLTHPELTQRTGQVVDAAMLVHSRLGPGLLESAYDACLAYELRSRGLSVLQQVPMPLQYGGVRLEVAYHADEVVDDAILIEIKAVAKLAPVHAAQLLSYLHVSGLPVGFLIIFHEPHLRDGLKRFTHG